MPDLVAAGPARRTGLRRGPAADLGPRRRRAARRPPPAAAGPPEPLLEAHGPGRAGRRRRRAGRRPAAGPSRRATPSSWPPAARPARRKGVVLTHDAVAASAAATSARLGVDAPRPLAGLPAPGPRRRAVRGDPGDRHGHAPHGAPGLRRHGRRGGGRGRAPRWCRWSRPRCAASIPALFRVIVLGGARPPADRPGQRRHHLRPDRDRQRRRLRRPAARRRRGARRPTTARSSSAARCCCAAYRDGTDPKDADGWLPTGDLGALDGRRPARSSTAGAAT